jgi:hypothetical protein
MSLLTVAKQYVGITELPNNSGWKDKDFEAKMRATGWNIGEAYCSYWVELCLKEAYPHQHRIWDKLCSGSAVQTFKNFKKAGYEISTAPVANSIVIWQQYKAGVASWQGHAGICTAAIDNQTFRTYEANTSAAGSREGNIIAAKLRTTAKKATGLNTLGFIIID